MKTGNISRSILTMAVAAGSVQHMQAQVSGQTSSPNQLIDAMHAAFGNNHARAVHAKGIILEGTFIPDAQAARLSKAFHLQKQSSRITVRFSDFTGIPTIPDNIAAANPRGLAIKFQTADGKTTDIISHSFNGFPTSNSDEFRELLMAISVSGAGAPAPTRLDSFLSTHPVAKTFLTTQKTPASYGAISYFGVNSFKFTNSKGTTKFIRYQFIPENGEEILDEKQVAAKGPDYLSKEIKDRVLHHPIRFKMYAQVAEEGDQIADPSIAWPDSRKKILLGVIVINKLAANTTEQDKALSFSPNNIPDGIETADPMLDFRSKTYPVSLKERQ